MKSFFTLVLAVFLISGCAEKDAELTAEKVTPAGTEAVAGTSGATESLPGGSEISALDLARPDATAPTNGNGVFPLGWEVRLDRPNAEAVISADSTADVYLVNMTPGWHFRTRAPRVILYHPASTATGSYTISSKIHLFDPGPRTEAYGLIFGGSDLGGENQAYLYFVIRRTGEYLVKHRIGDQTHVVQDWTAHESIVPFEPGSDIATATNTLTVSVDGDMVSFLVNDVEVHSMTSTYPTDGLVGFRFNHGVEAHIESLDVTMN
jgi:hypothetical protein